MDRPVTVRWKKAPLGEALLEISRATGVRLSADRALVNEPLMAAAEQLPARTLLEEIARLLHFTWVRSPGTAAAPHYLLIQDRAARLEEQAAIDGAWLQVVQALEQQLALCRRIGRLPPALLERELAAADRMPSETTDAGRAERAALRGLRDAGVLRAVAAPIGRAMTDLLDGLTPEQWRRLRDEQPLCFSSRPDSGDLPLPGAIADRLRAARPDHSSLGAEAAAALVEAEQKMQDRWAEARDFKVTVTLSLQGGAHPSGMLRLAPQPVDGRPAQFLAAALTLMAEPGSLDPPEDAAEREARERRLAADPLLGKAAVLKLPPLKRRPGSIALDDGYPVSEILPAVAEAYGVRLIGDAYSMLWGVRVPPPGQDPVPLYRLLDRMTAATRTWERDGAVIRLRSRHWAHYRRAEIPRSELKRWLAVRTKQGGFTLDDLGEMASRLRDAQIDCLVVSAHEAEATGVTDFVQVANNRGFLRFWGRLLPQQRRVLLAGEPLSAHSLLPNQQAGLLTLQREQTRSLGAILRGVRPVWSPEQLAGATFTLTRQERPAPPSPGDLPPDLMAEQSAGQVAYTFRVTLSDGGYAEYQVRLRRQPAPR